MENKEPTFKTPEEVELHFNVLKLDIQRKYAELRQQLEVDFRNEMAANWQAKREALLKVL